MMLLATRFCHRTRRSKLTSDQLRSSQIYFGGWNTCERQDISTIINKKSELASNYNRQRAKLEFNIETPVSYPQAETLYPIPTFMTNLRKHIDAVLALTVVFCCFVCDGVHGWIPSHAATTSIPSVKQRRNGHHELPALPSSSRIPMGFTNDDISFTNSNEDEEDDDVGHIDPASKTRRNAIKSCTVIAASSMLVDGSLNVVPSVAAVGTLPDYADTNAVLQGLTVNVADLSQQESMIKFLTNGFDFQVLRKRIRGTVEETVSINLHSSRLDLLMSILIDQLTMLHFF